ncbi:hypothetical protein QFZ80_003054 [Paenibacillus sp. V4I7]|nr:hypothetical protein [Paenibacillus sp. V4I7]MDQ0914784.1 hypothetical protein [Paenibacillus sp. V4I5]
MKKRIIQNIRLYDSFDITLIFLKANDLFEGSRFFNVLRRTSNWTKDMSKFRRTAEGLGNPHSPLLILKSYNFI